MNTANNEILIQFNQLAVDADGSNIYYQIRPYTVALSGHLNELQGVLENRLLSLNQSNQNGKKRYY